MDETSDDTIATYLPKVRGYVVNHYSWISRRGHCLLDIDDLIQIVSILLVTIAAEWEERGDPIGGTDKNRARFFAYLKSAIKKELLTEVRDRRFDTETQMFDSFDLPTDPETGVENRTTAAAYRSAHIPRAPDMLHGEAAEYFLYLPPRNKMLFALRYFDELTHSQIGELMGMSRHSVSARLQDEIIRWRRHCLNLCTSTFEELPVRRTRAWEPPPALIEYIQDRYRSDIPGYLGFFTIALRLDVGYLTGILKPERNYVPDSHRGRRAFTELEEKRIDDLLHAGHTHREIAEMFGVGKSTITRHAARS